VAVLLVGEAAWAQGAKALKKCPPDAVVSGTVCMDKYEASVWRVPPGHKVIKKILAGKAKLADLTAAGATQLGTASDNYGPCTDNGQTSCGDIYAVSLPGVTPARFITWFQAQQACKNARKRLPSNAEWQAAVAGTPDPGPDDGTTDCNSLTAIVATGSRAACVSNDGTYDMVGNLNEWVADWVPLSTHCPGPEWGAFSNDVMCLSGASTTDAQPGALVRGGDGFGLGTRAGPLAILGGYSPSSSAFWIGFRCAR
jgi:hypothetical protein